MPALRRHTRHGHPDAPVRVGLAVTVPGTQTAASLVIHGMHHCAFRCRDSEQTRAFYEDFLGLPLVNVLEIRSTKTGRATHTLHSFFAMADGSCLAFFEAPDMPFDFKPQHDYDLHIALSVDHAVLETLRERALRHGVETRGIVDHGLFDSLYLRDPNGYVIEFVSQRNGQGEATAPARSQARDTLNRWTASRCAQPGR